MSFSGRLNRIVATDSPTEYWTNSVAGGVMGYSYQHRVAGEPYDVNMTSNFGSTGKGAGMRITWRGIVLILIAVILIVFGVQNLNSAQINFLGMQFDIPVWLLVPGTFILGMFLGGAVRGTARKLRKPKAID